MIHIQSTNTENSLYNPQVTIYMDDKHIHFKQWLQLVENKLFGSTCLASFIFLPRTPNRLNNILAVARSS